MFKILITKLTTFELFDVIIHNIVFILKIFNACSWTFDIQNL